MSEKINALVKALSLESNEGIVPAEFNKLLFEVEDDGGTYMVVTRKEREEEFKNALSSTLWSFTSSFILEYCGLEPYEGLEEGIELMQEKACENSNDLIRALIDGTCGFNNFVENVVDADMDSYANILAQYDGEELQEGKYFIYRVE